MHNNMSKHKINNVIRLLKVRVEITASGADGDKDLLSKFLLLREVRLRLERVRSTMLTKPTRATLFLLTLLPMQDAVIPLLGHLRAVTEPVQMETLGDGHRTRTNAR